MNNDTVSNPKASLTLPNMFTIPILSTIYTIIKLCGGVSWNWAVILIIAPLATYIGWSIGLVVIFALCNIALRRNSNK